jgi:uncharacterized glyoxalase superfamily protein PhnB
MERKMAEAAFELVGLAPVLHVKDMIAALAYYRDTLGFAVTFTWKEPPRYVCLRLDDVSIHLNSYVPPEGPSHVAIFCKGVDALYERLASRGVAFAEPITNEPYGMREFVVTDPDGHRLVFGQGTGEH